MIKACLFDLFGTLISNTKLGGNAPVDELPFSRNESMDILSKSGGITGLSPKDGRNRVHENAKAYFEYDDAQMPDLILPGALDFVKDLHHNGIRLASTSTDGHPEKILSRVGLYSLFDAIIDPGATARRPDPEVLRKAAERLGLKSAECVAVESTPEGVEAARAAGMRCLAVGDLTRLYRANMGVQELKGMTLLKLKDGIEPSPNMC
jgi:beta-phosphoglucomutase